MSCTLLASFSEQTGRNLACMSPKPSATLWWCSLFYSGTCSLTDRKMGQMAKDELQLQPAKLAERHRHSNTELSQELGFAAFARLFSGILFWFVGFCYSTIRPKQYILL